MEDNLRLTDTSNAEKIANMFGDKIRFDHKRGRWLVWDQHIWKPDSNGEVVRFAIEAARSRYLEASKENNIDYKKKISSWAITSESKQKIDAALGLAKNILPISDDGSNWDQNNMLLSVSNGIIDLTSGSLMQGMPEDRITMCANVEFDKKAQSPLWIKFLNEVFENNNELINYVQKALGYSITGSVEEQVMFFCFGTGSNGKSVLFRTISEILGDYACKANASLFQRNFGTSSNDLASIEYKRFLVSSETLSTSKLNEERLKTLTGGDTVTARYLYSEYFTFEPKAKPWLFVNHKPQAEDDSYGFWRRVRVIPFNRVFLPHERDNQLFEKLKAEKSGILNWLIEGCLLWQKEKLTETPEIVKISTEEYQTENDQLADFLFENYPNPIAEVRAIEVYQKYKEWAEKIGLTQKDILNNKAFSRRMKDKFHKDRTERGNVYRNVGFQHSFVPKCMIDPTFSKTPLMREHQNSFIKTTLNPTAEAKNPTESYSHNLNDSKDEADEEYFNSLLDVVLPTEEEIEDL